MPNVSNTCKIMKTQHPKACYILALVIWFFLGGCTYTVNTTLDRPDTNPGDYKCISLVPINFVTGPPPGGGTSPTHVERCSLRAAVMEANFNSARDTIVVPSGHYTLNLAPASGGGPLEITEDVEILGTDATTTIVDAGNEVVFPAEFDCDVSPANFPIRVFHITDGDVFIRGLTVKGGNAQFGGGIRIDDGTVDIRDAVVRENFAFTGGGGILIAVEGKATIRRSSILANCATGAFGGGILNQGTLLVYDSTIANNESNRAGGIENSDSGILVLKNTTVSGNLANSDSAGTGGIRTDGFANLNNVTVTNNTGFAQGGGVKTWPSKNTVIKNSIIADNHDGGGADDDCQGKLTFDSQDNLIGNTNGCDISGFLSTYLLDVSPQLGPLTNNGGITLTHNLQSNSPAIDAAVPSFGNPPPDVCEEFDQRGVPRPQGQGVCDMGAVEVTSANSFLLGFFLVDAAANSDIRPLLYGDTLDLSELPPELSIRVEVNFPKPVSVVFGFDGDPSLQTENQEPYALGGDSPPGDYHPVALSTGTHTLIATPFAGNDGSGAAGGSLTISFDVQS